METIVCFCSVKTRLVEMGGKRCWFDRVVYCSCEQAPSGRERWGINRMAYLRLNATFCWPWGPWMTRVAIKTNSYFIIAGATQTLTHTDTHSVSKITPAPHRRWPFHHRGHITVSEMCRAAAWINHIAPMKDGSISKRGLQKVTVKLVPVRLKAT